MKPENFPVDRMLENAACASQHMPILNGPVVRGALLRSIHQWLLFNDHRPIPDLIRALAEHKDYNR